MAKKTIREAYLDYLTEIVKEQSPTLYVEDFLYYYNKAVMEYQNLRYEKFGMTQQLTDDMRSWVKYFDGTDLKVDISTLSSFRESDEKRSRALANSSEIEVPEKISVECDTFQKGCEDRYLEECRQIDEKRCIEICGKDDLECIEAQRDPKSILACASEKAWVKQANCLQTFIDMEKEKIYVKELERLTSTYRHVLSCVVEIELQRPIKNCEQGVGKNKTRRYKVQRSSEARKSGIIDNVYLDAKFYRPYFSIQGDILNIDVGEIDTRWVKVKSVVIEYLGTAVNITLTEEEIESEEDTSQVLEFTADVAGEILKRTLMLVLERGGNPRMQTHVGVNQSINDISLGMK